MAQGQEQQQTAVGPRAGAGHVLHGRQAQLLSFCGTLTLGLSSDMKTIVKDFESFGPTLLLAVPSVFEKV